MVRPMAKPFTNGCRGGKGQRSGKVVFTGVQTQDHNSAHMRIVLLDDIASRQSRWSRLQKVPASTNRDRCQGHRSAGSPWALVWSSVGATLEGMISNSISSRLRRQAWNRRWTVSSCFGLGFGVVIGVVEAQHLDHMFQRPFLQAAKVGAKLGFKGQRARAGPFHGPPDPKPGTGGLEKRVAAKAAVTKHAIAPACRQTLAGPLSGKAA